MTTANFSGELQRFELVERIAVGGMAEVFKAKSYGPHGFEKTLAVKRILPELATQQEFIDRFVVEAKIAATLSHANIVQVLDFSRFGDSLYIAMEYVDGVDLAALLRSYRERGETIPLPAAIHVAVGMLHGLGAAHRQGVVHRDVSPSNVLLSRSGDVKITDFGIAKAAAGGSGHTQPFRILGKWRYMSPEQALGADLNTRSDVFSAAVVLFELFSGRRLYDCSDLDEIDRQRRGKVPSLSAIRSEIPQAIDALLAKALDVEPDFRLMTCEDMATALVDISFEFSAPSAGVELARLVRDLLEDEEDSDSDDSGSLLIIDQIINSELERNREQPASRVTMASTSPSLSFVTGGHDANGIKRWSLVGAEGEPFDAVLEKLLHSTMASDSDEAIRLDSADAPEPSTPEAAPKGAATGMEAATRNRHLWSLLGLLAITLASAAAFFVWRDLQDESVRVPEPVAADSKMRAAGPAKAADDAASGAVAAPALVRVTSQPAGATIFVAGTNTGLQTPSDVDVAEPQATTPIVVKLPGFLDCEMRARSLPESRESIAHCDLQDIGATLVVASEPSGAHVFLDEQPLGKTPLEVHLRASDEKSSIRIEKAGRQAESAEVELVSGKRIEVFRRLEIR